MFMYNGAKDVKTDQAAPHLQHGASSAVLAGPHTSHEMAEDEEPDVIINIHKGLDGYGIFFAQREEGMVVTKLDKGSEAEKAGVQPGDRLVRVQDNDGKLPMNAPGREVPVTKADYQESPAGRGCGMAAAQRPAGLRRAVHHGS